MRHNLDILDKKNAKQTNMYLDFDKNNKKKIIFFSIIK